MYPDSSRGRGGRTRTTTCTQHAVVGLVKVGMRF